MADDEIELKATNEEDETSNKSSENSRSPPPYESVIQEKPKNGGYFNPGFETEDNDKIPAVYDHEEGLERDKSRADLLKEEEDPWDLPEFKIESVAWADLDTKGRIKRVLWDYFFRFVVLIVMLYLFICSLAFLGSAFQLLGGKEAGEAFRNDDILGNPVAGLMIGVLATVLVQSSSTSTSIVVAMVSAGALDVQFAVFIIMGANIGTSVTNTIVALGQMSDKNEFRRAFAAATVHDMFNWLSVTILLVVEWTTGYLFRFSGWLVEGVEKGEFKNTKLLKVITEPFTKLVISLDKKIIVAIATKNKTAEEVSTIIKTCWKTSLNKTCNATRGILANETLQDLEKACTGMRERKKGCYYLFDNVAEVWDDKVIGAVLLVVALAIMIICLVLIVKLLQSMLKGRIAKLIRKFLNADFPGYLSWLTGYVAILIGAGMTILVQSSSIFTSSMTPLVGMGLVTIYRMYPLTLGANIGTTFTAVLAALASDNLHDTLQIAMCHLFFNISGILIWYPIPFMRKVPISLAKFLGNTVAEYRWFAFVYILIMFFLFPLSVFALALPGWYVLLAVYGPVLLVVIFVVIVNILQKKKASVLPEKLRTWNFLPEWMRSLAPLDRQINKIRCCGCCRSKDDSSYTMGGP